MQDPSLPFGAGHGKIFDRRSPPPRERVRRLLMLRMDGVVKRLVSVGGEEKKIEVGEEEDKKATD